MARSKLDVKDMKGGKNVPSKEVSVQIARLLQGKE